MTDLYQVVGNPISQSKSPRIHQLFAQQTLQDIEYHAACFGLDSFVTELEAFFDNGGCGMNITVPFKLQAFDRADELDPLAEKAGAVNTLVKLKTEKGVSLKGYNTDGIGLVRDLINKGFNFNQSRILVLGAGGAVRGVLEPILNQQPTLIHIWNRTQLKAKELAQLFSNTDGTNCQISAVNSEEYGQEYDLIINGTSASLAGEKIDLPSSLLGSHTRCYDMMYGAKPTAFIEWASQNGCKHCYDGLGMLVEQAAEAFYIWRNKRPETAAVIELLRKELNDSQVS